MVVYALSAAKLYGQLQKLEAAAEQEAGDTHPPLQFHNFVNGDTSTRLQLLTLRFHGSVSLQHSYLTLQTCVMRRVV